MKGYVKSELVGADDGLGLILSKYYKKHHCCIFYEEEYILELNVPETLRVYLASTTRALKLCLHS